MKAIGILAVGCAVMAVLTATPVQAQATRTWVSGVGDDVNPCSRTAPCKTFAGAIAKTAVGGEINCLDPGGFGSIIIKASITIDCGGTLGSIHNPNASGIVINGANAAVTLRNLAINGVGTGNIGVHLLNGSALHLANVRIFGFGAANGAGVSIEAVGSTVHIEGSTIYGNREGVRVRSTGAATVMLFHSTLSGNAAIGLSADGSGTRIRVGDTTISGNGVGIQVTNGGAVASYGDNRLNDNTSDGTFTGPVSPRR